MGTAAQWEWGTWSVEEGIKYVLKNPQIQKDAVCAFPIPDQIVCMLYLSLTSIYLCLIKLCIFHCRNYIILWFWKSISHKEETANITMNHVSFLYLDDL